MTKAIGNNIARPAGGDEHCVKRQQINSVMNIAEATSGSRAMLALLRWALVVIYRKPFE
jgi:hypothetical protein